MARALTRSLLGRRRPSPRLQAWFGAGAVAAASAALYSATLVRDVSTADNAELQLVAAQLGLAHPPGFPLYTILAHLATRLLPTFDPAFPVNLFAVLTSSATVVVVYALALRLGRSVPAALLAAASLAVSTTFWAQATVANVRSLTGLLAALVLWAAVQFQTTGRRRWLDLAALSLSLGVTHHLSLAFMGGIALATVAWQDRAAWRRWARPIAFGLLGCLPLLYLPWRSAELRDPGAFLHYALGLGFGGDFFYFIQPAVLWERLRVMGNVWTFQFPVWLLLGMALGWLRLLRRNRPTAVLLGGSVVIHTLITAAYRAPQTVEYMLPAYVAAAPCLAAALRPWSGRGAIWLRPAVLALLAGAVVLQGARGWSAYRPQIALRDARDYANGIFNDAPRNTLVLANWHWATTLWYLQAVEGARPDLEVVYVAPTGEPYAETWRQAIAAGLAAGRPTAATNNFAELRDALPLPQPLGEALLWPAEPLTALPHGFAPVEVVVGESLAVRGLAWSRPTVAQWESVALTLAWEPQVPLSGRFTLFAHLVGPDGALVAQDDVPTEARSDSLTLTRLTLTPRPGALPGVYRVLIGAYGHTAFDAAAAERRDLAELVMTAASRPPYTGHALWPSRRQDDGRRLIGYDWDTTLPNRPRLYLHWRTADGYVTETRDGPTAEAAGRRFDVAAQCRGGCAYVPLAHGVVWLGVDPLPALQAGQAVTRRQTFAAGRPILRDLVVSNALTGLAGDGAAWAWRSQHDGVPALGAIPTLKWIGGSRVRDPHPLAVPADAAAGQTVRETLLLYDAFTGQSIAVLDAQLAAAGPGIRVGETQGRSPAAAAQETAARRPSPP